MKRTTIHSPWKGFTERTISGCSGIQIGPWPNVDEKDKHARRRNHPFDLGFALTLGSHAFDYCRSPEALMRRAEEAENLGRDHGVKLMSEIMAQIVKGVAWLRAGRVADSIGKLRESIDGLSNTGHRIYVTYLDAVLAEAIARTGDVADGLDRIEKSLRRVDENGERVHLAEILRLKGWMLQQRGNPDGAVQILRAAIRVAQEQGARSWELRGA